jgi:hypothetical protein
MTRCSSCARASTTYDVARTAFDAGDHQCGAAVIPPCQRGCSSTLSVFIGFRPFSSVRRDFHRLPTKCRAKCSRRGGLAAIVVGHSPAAHVRTRQRTDPHAIALDKPEVTAPFVVRHQRVNERSVVGPAPLPVDVNDDDAVCARQTRMKCKFSEISIGDDAAPPLGERVGASKASMGAGKGMSDEVGITSA